MKAFLGGTCNNSTWRDKIIPKLECDYFNPIVKDWTPADQKEEIKQRNTCDIVVYIITKEMTGVYSIAEAVDDSNKKPDKVVFGYLKSGFSKSQKKSLDMVSKMIDHNGGIVIEDLNELVDLLNDIERNE